MIGEMGAMGNTPDQYIKSIQRAQEFGASLYTVAFPRDSLAESMKQFMDEVAPSF